MDFAIARHNMVDNQIRTSQVADPRIIAAFEAVPREAFLPAAKRSAAYVDEDIPLGNGRFMQEPLVLARLLQIAGIRATDVVLQVGCATGYEAAVIARLAGAVVALEADAELASRSARALVQEEIDTVSVVQGPLAAGWPAQAPYDVIVLTGAATDVPRALTDQLADDGRLVGVVRHGPGGRGMRFVRTGQAVSVIDMFDAATPYLPGLEPQPTFTF